MSVTSTESLWRVRIWEKLKPGMWLWAVAGGAPGLILLVMVIAPPSVKRLTTPSAPTVPIEVAESPTYLNLPFDRFLEHLNNKNLTKLQQLSREQEYEGSTVYWTGVILEISPLHSADPDGSILVVLKPYLFPFLNYKSASIVFPAVHREDLARIRKGDVVDVHGTIESLRHAMISIAYVSVAGESIRKR